VTGVTKFDDFTRNAFAAGHKLFERHRAEYHGTEGRVRRYKPAPLRTRPGAAFG
jgi:hypothetical protein